MGGLPKQTKRRALIKRFKELGFTGPHQGRGKHPEFMARGDNVVKLPNNHRGDIGEGLLKTLISEAGLTPEQWLGEPPAQTTDQRAPAVPDVAATVPEQLAKGSAANPPKGKSSKL